MRRLVPLGLLTLALSTTACGALGSPEGPASSAPPPASSAPAPSAGTTSAAPAPASATPADPSASSGGELGQVAASRTSAKGGQKIIASLYPVQRDGAVSHLNLALSQPAGATKSVQVGDLLADDNYDAIDHDGLTADGLQLVDGAHAKLYLVASDGNGQCLCSRGLSRVFVQGDAPVLISATFAAPPPDVTSVDVRVPGFGTVKGVPVQ